MDKELINIFKEIDNTIGQIDEFNQKNYWVIRKSDDYEIDPPCDPETIKILEDEELLFNRQRVLINKARELINELPEPTSVKSDIFTSNFGNTQDALDYIDKKLKGKNIMYGVRELFEGLAYNSKVNSYSSLNLYYMQYKFPEIFGSNVTLVFDDADIDYKSVLLDSFKQFDED